MLDLELFTHYCLQFGMTYEDRYKTRDIYALCFDRWVILRISDNHNWYMEEARTWREIN